MSTEPVVYEVFEEERPSYFPSYIMSTFLLLGVISLAYHHVPLWPLSLAHLFMLIWFGVLFTWILRNAKDRKMFMSNRLVVTGDTYRHSFRYAVAESTFVEIPIADIVEVKVLSGKPQSIEVIGKSEVDFYCLPPSANVEQLVAALRAANPAIRLRT